MQSNKRKRKILHLGRNSPMNQYMLGANQLEKQLFIKGPGGLGGQENEHEPTMCPHSKEGYRYLGLH